MSHIPLLKALVHIASYRSGGLVKQGECSGDRSNMIHTARQALMARYDTIASRALVMAEREIREAE